MTAKSHTQYPAVRVLRRTLVDVAGCWLYQGPLDRDGYGLTSVPSSKAKRGWGTTRVHRAVYEDPVGPILEEMTLDHLCKVRNCVRPDHLEPCTVGENVMRSNSLQAQYAKRTHCKNGHPFNGLNLFLKKNGQGHGCRQCMRDGRARWLAKKEKNNG